MDGFDHAARIIESRDGIEAALALLSRKNDLVRAAHEAGYSKTEIHRLTGIARSTLDRILMTSSG